VQIEGVWRARLEFSLHTPRWQNTELNRVRTDNGTLVEHEERGIEFIGFLEFTEPAPAAAPVGAFSSGGSGGGAAPVGASSSGGGGFSSFFDAIFKNPKITISPDYPRCKIHGPNLVVTAATEHVSLPLEWLVDGAPAYEGGKIFTTSAGFSRTIEVTCREKAKYSGPARASVSGTFSPGQCQAVMEEIRGASWDSSHSATDASTHLPRIEAVIGGGFAPLCPATSNTVTWLGFQHASPVNTRNLSQIITPDPKDLADHCMAVTWANGGKINLYSLLASVCDPYKDDLSFVTSEGTVDSHGFLLFPKDNPKIRSPQTSCIQLKYQNDPRVYDFLWIVINRSDASTDFSRWLARNASTAWTAALPSPYPTLALSGGNVVDPEPGAPRLWGTPHRINSYMHHDAKYEMRSVPIGADGNGHQATYDAAGNLITDPIAAGTADIFAPVDAHGIVRRSTTHRNEDVRPFILALQLDGNPVKPNSNWAPTDFNRPCLYKASYVNQYISKRPVLP
jgi:hypothetical protein